MKTRYIVRRAGRSLRHAKIRTLLTSLAIAVGAFTLTLSLAAGEGSRQYADKIISSNINPQSLFIVKDKSLVGEGGNVRGGGLQEYSETAEQYGGMSIDTIAESELKKIENDDKIASVTPMYLVKAKYVTFQGDDGKYTSDITVFDTSVRAESVAGELPELGKNIADDEIVVPEDFLTTLKINDFDSMIGKKVTLHLVKQNQPPTPEELAAAKASEDPTALQKLVAVEEKDVSFKISAISKNSVTSLSASSSLFISKNQAKELSDYLTKDTPQYRNYAAVVAIAKDGVDPESAKASVEKYGVTARTAEDLQSFIFTIVNLLQGIVIGFGVLALIASVFGIINTQYISVLERTQQIGLMKALGMRGRDVARLFRYEAAWIGFLGGVIGSMLAIGLGLAMNPWITEQLKLGEGNYLLIFEPIPIILLIIGLMLVAIVAGWLPARKASKLDPIEALRTE